MYWILFIGIALASWLVQANLKNKFEKYSKIPIDGGLTGRDIAVKMLHDNGIYDVEVVSTSGSLTDHYNPANKTVNLSEDVYGTCTFASNWMMWVLLIGMFTLNVFPQIMLFGIILFAATTLFSFITLPVEIDASRRAVKWLSEAGVTNNRNYGAAVSALRSAAYTYVVAALGSLATLLYYVMIFLGRRD